jgi:hypothetical protein
MGMRVYAAGLQGSDFMILKQQLDIDIEHHLTPIDPKQHWSARKTRPHPPPPPPTPPPLLLRRCCRMQSQKP